MTVHHIVFDAWSAGLFREELIRWYGEFAGGVPAAAPALPVRFVDHLTDPRALPPVRRRFARSLRSLPPSRGASPPHQQHANDRGEDNQDGCHQRNLPGTLTGVGGSLPYAPVGPGALLVGSPLTAAAGESPLFGAGWSTVTSTVAFAVAGSVAETVTVHCPGAS
ncbi:hypothetical protein FXF52_26830 [Micromonospora sp. MP36]|nr:hypothetical protein FXF52_26830 [Micromonospora sp. MP36]